MLYIYNYFVLGDIVYACAPKSKQPYVFVLTGACGSSNYHYIHTFATRKQTQITSHPHPSLFVFLWFHAFFLPSVARLPPSSRLLDAFATPPERGLMRANDGNACCCFPFINGSTLAHQNTAFHHQQSAIKRRLLFSLHLSPPRSVSHPSPLSSLKWSGFLSVSLNLYLSSPSLFGLALTTTPSSMNTNRFECGPYYCFMSFQWADGKVCELTHLQSDR